MIIQMANSFYPIPLIHVPNISTMKLIIYIIYIIQRGKHREIRGEEFFFQSYTVTLWNIFDFDS